MTFAEIITIAIGTLGVMGAIISSAVIVGNRVGRMEQQLSQIVKHLEHGEKRMDEIDSHIDDHSVRLVRLEASRG